MSTAAVVIIGNEILTGKFADENGPFLIARLRALGVDLRRMVVVPDVLDEIADEVRRCAARYDHVFTTGGVGPTHDDITFEGVALAFGVPLEESAEMVALMRAWGLPTDAANLRMAAVPAGTELIADPALSHPVVKVRNVWVFPGVPHLFRLKFEVVAARFADQAVLTDRVYVTESEARIAERLTSVAQAHPDVDIGSYPRYDSDRYKVIITLECRDSEALRRAGDAVRAALPWVAL
jgi:molybdenum cofactor synthesis domain-containing protein